MTATFLIVHPLITKAIGPCLHGNYLLQFVVRFDLSVCFKTVYIDSSAITQRIDYQNKQLQFVL